MELSLDCAVDPGVHFCGVAFQWASHWHVGYLPTAEAIAKVKGYRGIVELPRIYPNSPNPEDLLQLGFVAGKVAVTMGTCRVVRPHEWKGNVPKKEHNARVMESAKTLLSPTAFRAIELDLKAIGAKAHNAIDALGLLMFGLGMTSVRGDLFRRP